MNGDPNGRLERISKTYHGITYDTASCAETGTGEPDDTEMVQSGSGRGVRHEVVCIAVGAEYAASHLGFCPQYPTKTCGESNLAV